MSKKLFAGLPVHSTREVFGPNTKVCMMVYQAPKRGKTTFAASLDKVTKKYDNKPTLFVSMEASDGGGTLSLKDLDIDYVQPRTRKELDGIIAALQRDTYYGGVVIDSASEYVKRFLQPFALQNTFPGANYYPTRQYGVPARNDYQFMGEVGRIFFNRLIELTSTPDLSIRKHLIVTALIKEKFDEKGNLYRVCPDLPGAMSDSATAMFQTVAQIGVKAQAVPDPNDPTGKKRKRVHMHFLRTKSDGVEILDDRTGIFPNNFPLTDLDGNPVGLDKIFEEFWIPAVEKTTKERQDT